MLPSTHKYPRIAVEHPELSGRVERGPSFTNDNIFTDCNGHGTAVASLIAGLTVGIARSTRIVALRVLKCDAGGNTDWVNAAAAWALKDARARKARPILHLSLNSERVPALDRVYKEVVEQGGILVAAAGNQGANACDIHPASSPDVISVGAIKSDEHGDYRATFSNYGSCVGMSLINLVLCFSHLRMQSDLFAPGESVRCAVVNSTGLLELSGTSVAAPLVTGTIAQLVSTKPNISVSEIKDALQSKYSISGSLDLKCGGLKTPAERVQCRKTTTMVLQTYCNNGQIAGDPEHADSTGERNSASWLLVLLAVSLSLFLIRQQYVYMGK